MVPTPANGQPAAAAYLRAPDDASFRAAAIVLPRIQDGRIAQLTAFHAPGLFAAFALPKELTLAHR